MKEKTTGYYLIVALLALTAAVFIFWRSASAEAAYPFERGVRFLRVSVGSRLAGFFRGAAARAENVRLRREVAALALVRTDLERAEEENARLRRALDYTLKTPETWLAASILSEEGPAAGVCRFLRVDKGSLAGVRKGAVVVVPEGLVGRVTDVTPHTAVVSPVTLSSVKVACEVEAPGSRLRGILCGGSDDLLVVRHLTGAAEVPPRSRVLTSGLGGVFPRGLVIGTWQGIRSEGPNLLCVGEVLPAVDFSSLEDVFIRREK